MSLLLSILYAGNVFARYPTSMGTSQDIWANSNRGFPSMPGAKNDRMAMGQQQINPMLRNKGADSQPFPRASPQGGNSAAGAPAPFGGMTGQQTPGNRSVVPFSGKAGQQTPGDLGPGNKPTAPFGGSGSNQQTPDGSGYADRLNAFKNALESEFHNKDFGKTVQWDLETFLQFMESDPRAKDIFKKLLTNYGVIDTASAEGFHLDAPDVQHLLKTLEEALSIHTSFKMFTRRLLQTIDEHIRVVYDKIKTDVRVLKSILNELVNLQLSARHTRSAIRKGEFLKEFATLLVSAVEPINDFKKRVEWVRKMEKGLQDKI